MPPKEPTVISTPPQEYTQKIPSIQNLFSLFTSRNNLKSSLLKLAIAASEEIEEGQVLAASFKRGGLIILREKMERYGTPLQPEMPLGGGTPRASESYSFELNGELKGKGVLLQASASAYLYFKKGQGGIWQPNYPWQVNFTREDNNPLYWFLTKPRGENHE